MGYLWDIFGIFWGYLGDILGISWGYLGDILGISLSERTSGVPPVIFLSFLNGGTYTFECHTLMNLVLRSCLSKTTFFYTAKAKAENGKLFAIICEVKIVISLGNDEMYQNIHKTCKT